MSGGKPHIEQVSEPFMTRGARYAAVFLFCFSLALAGANLLFTSTLVHRAAAAKASVTQLCQSGNEARQQQIDLWAFVIQISPPPPCQTPAQAAQRAHVLHRFALRLHKIF